MTTNKAFCPCVRAPHLNATAYVRWRSTIDPDISSGCGAVCLQNKAHKRNSTPPWPVFTQWINYLLRHSDRLYLALIVPFTYNRLPKVGKRAAFVSGLIKLRNNDTRQRREAIFVLLRSKCARFWRRLISKFHYWLPKFCFHTVWRPLNSTMELPGDHFTSF